jgi:gluconate 2-dehydrogenase gamma chain
MLVGAGALVVGSGARGATTAHPPATSAHRHAAQPPEALHAREVLTQAEYEILDAIVARLIPADANGPGAREAGAARYIDRALAGALATSRAAYNAGLAAIEDLARANGGKGFAALAPAAQDSVLARVEKGGQPGFVGDSAAFFLLVRAHTLQGTFGDPYYGGNADFIGWDLIAYPGIQMPVPANAQRLGAHPPPHRESAYSDGMFTSGGGHGH